MIRIPDSQSRMIPLGEVSAGESELQVDQNNHALIGSDFDSTTAQAFNDLAQNRMTEMNIGAQILQSQLNGILNGGSAYIQGGAYAGVRGSAFGDVDWENLSAKAGFEAQAGAGFHVDGGYSTPSNLPAGVDGSIGADGFIGARAAGDGEISLNENGASVDINGEAFTGVRAGIDGGNGISLDGEKIAGANYGAEGWAGIGATGNIDVGFKDGKFRFNIFGGAAFGIGGKISLGFEVDFKNIAKLSAKFLGKLTNAAGVVGKTLLSSAKGIGSGVLKIGSGLASGLSSGISGLANSAVSAGKSFVDGAKSAVHTFTGGLL